MSKTRALSVSLLCLLSSLTGCTNNLPKLEKQVNNLEDSLTDLRNFQAEQTTKLASLEAQVRTLTGSLEELQYSQSRALGGDLNALKRDLGDLQRRVPPPPLVPSAELESDELLLPSMAANVADRFADALRNIRGGKYEQALAPLQESMDLSVGENYAPNLIFWNAIAYEGIADNRKALQNYIDLTGRFPKHSRAALGLLRQAAILQKLGDKKSAKLTLNKLIADFPKSKEASAARDRIKELA